MSDRISLLPESALLMEYAFPTKSLELLAALGIWVSSCNSKVNYWVLSYYGIFFIRMSPVQGVMCPLSGSILVDIDSFSAKFHSLSHHAVEVEIN